MIRSFKITTCSRKLIAVVECTQKYPIVTLWDVQLFKKRKTLTLPSDKDINVSRYVCVDFSFDSKYIICVAGEPDWNLFCFKCDKGRLESFGKANNPNGTGTILQVNVSVFFKLILLCYLYKGSLILKNFFCISMPMNSTGLSIGLS